MDSLASATGDDFEVPVWVKRRDLFRIEGRRTVAYAATSGTGKSHIRKEIDLYSWGHGNDIPLPAVVAAETSGGFIAFEKVPVDPPYGHDYVQLAVAAADRFNTASAPPASALSDRPRRGARLRSAPLRLYRMSRTPLKLREIVAVRARFERLSSTTLGHCDFHTGNVLYDAAGGRVRVVDLEYVGMAPALMDLATLWATLERPDDRAALMEAMRERASRQNVGHVGLIVHYAVLRFLEEVTTWTPHGRWNEARVKQGFVALDTARQLDVAWQR